MTHVHTTRSPERNRYKAPRVTYSLIIKNVEILKISVHIEMLTFRGTAHLERRKGHAETLWLIAGKVK